MVPIFHLINNSDIEQKSGCLELTEGIIPITWSFTHLVNVNLSILNLKLFFQQISKLLIFSSDDVQSLFDFS